MGRAADVDLVLYIGESTSSLNMSLYGYPLPTTPVLDALAGQAEGFLKFDHVPACCGHGF
jgi:glucan phosphoethanolaminetransferase (alkaline phosphatase superfamily)